MTISCVWEHNGADTLLYAAGLPGAYARGGSLEAALANMDREVRSYLAWAGQDIPASLEFEIVQEAACGLTIRDADSDVLFQTETGPLGLEQYQALKALALKSAGDFLALYEAVPDPDRTIAPPRRSFYGPIPATAREMYGHTKSVNDYYFSEIGVEADQEGTILACRRRGFDALESQPDYLANPVFDGSWGEQWTLKKLLRRFLWHDRIHGKALYRRASLAFGSGTIPDVFCFGSF